MSSAFQQAETTVRGKSSSANARMRSYISSCAATDSFPQQIQTKLTVNTPGDKFEQEADRVAEQVMRMPEPQVQRQCACGKSSTEGECSECKKKKQEVTGNLQRVASSPVGGMTAPPIVNDVLGSPGSALPTGERSFMESRFGQDFSHVRVHTDQRAAESAAAVQARAYTVGNNIVFGNGHRPSSDHRLLAHELTHVVQQSGSSDGTVQRELTLASPPTKSSRDLSKLSLAELQNEYKAVKSLLDRPMSYPDRWVDEIRAQELRDELAKRGTYDACEGEACALGTSQQGRRVNAYYFAGQTEERALVIGGVHGSELSGIEVAELLVANLKSAKTKPYYTVIVVPVLFPDNRALAESRPKSIGTSENVGRYTMKGGNRGKDPNRQMPALGKAFDPKNPVDSKGSPIESENVMLLELIDRFKPSRIASVHATRPEGGKDASGIYADPKTDEKSIALGVDDDAKLAIRMAERAKQGEANVVGNALDSKPTALYPLDAEFAKKGQRQKRNTSEGTSLGGWATTAVAGGRPAMTVITIEVQKSNPSLTPGDPEPKRSPSRLNELQAHAFSIQEIFLGPP
jgi:hypothetical protein